MISIRIIILLLQFACFFLTLSLFSRWFWLYTSSRITPSSSIDNVISEEVPLLDAAEPLSVRAYERHVRLLKYSFFAGLILLSTSFAEFIYDFVNSEAQVQDVALLFNCILIMAVTGFAAVECTCLASAVLVDYNRQDRLLSTLHALTRSVTASWAALLIVNASADIIHLINGTKNPFRFNIR